MIADELMDVICTAADKNTLFMRFTLLTGYDFNVKRLPKFIALNLLERTIEFVTLTLWNKKFNEKKISFALSNVIHMINDGQFDSLKENKKNIIDILQQHKEGLRFANHNLHSKVTELRDLIIERFDIGYEEKSHLGSIRFFLKESSSQTK